jgi:hypothetical protein
VAEICTLLSQELEQNCSVSDSVEAMKKNLTVVAEISVEETDAEAVVVEEETVMALAEEELAVARHKIGVHANPSANKRQGEVALLPTRMSSPAFELILGQA